MPTIHNNYAILDGAMLREAFPYQFSKDHISLEFYRGWMPIVAAVCVQLDRLLGDQRERFHWVQMKEKFGSARLYYAFDGAVALRLDIISPGGVSSLRQSQPALPELNQAVRDLVHAAERATRTACLVCGAPAEIQSYDNYLLNLCSEHQPDKIRRPGDTRWEAVWALATPRVPGGGSS